MLPRSSTEAIARKHLHGTRCDVPAVVVGGTLNSLGVVRSLSYGRMPIYVLDVTRLCSAAWSRYGQFIRTPSLESEPLIDRLVALAGQLACRPVLILTAEESVNALSTHRGRIEALYRISLPAAGTVRALSDKVLFQALGEREGFALPRAASLEHVADLEQLATLTPPLVLKPAEKIQALHGQCERAVRADTMEEARGAAKRLLANAPRVLVQEWIDGSDSDIYFTLFSCDRRGNILGMFTGRKLLSSPPYIGSTAVCVAAPEVADLIGAQTRQFIEKTGYRGMGSLEFKRDRRTGRFMIVEPTVGRTDLQEEIATLCGMNLPLMTYCAELDLPSPGSAVAGSDGTDGIFKPLAWRCSIEHRKRFWPSHEHLPVIDGFFRWNDPLPGVYYYGYERFARRLWQRGMRMFRPSSRSAMRSPV